MGQSVDRIVLKVGNGTQTNTEARGAQRFTEPSINEFKLRVGSMPNGADRLKKPRTKLTKDTKKDGGKVGNSKDQRRSN